MAVLVADIQVPIGCQDRAKAIAGLHRVRRIQLSDFHTSRTRGAPI